jgi:PAS domain S-box-containing protein
VSTVGTPLSESNGRGTQVATMIETLATAFRHTPVAMAVWTPDGQLIDANPAYSRLFGYEHDEFLARGSTEIAYPDEPWYDRAQWPRLVAGETDAYQREKRYLRKDGSVMWGLATIVALRDEHEGFVGCLVQVQDITAQKTAEAAARESEAHLTGIVEQLAVALYTLPPGGAATFRYVSPQFERQTGLGADDLSGSFEVFLQRVHPDDRQHFQAVDERARRNGEPVQAEYRLRGGSGEWIWVENRTVPARDERGHLVAWHGALLDITERKRLEASLHTSQERFRRAFEDAAIGMSIGTPDDVCLDANAAYCRIIGRQRQEVIGRPFAEFTHPDDIDAYARVQDRLFAGEIAAYEIEKRYLRPDGAVVTGLLTVSAVCDHEGIHLYDVALLQDITAQKAAEEASRHNELRLRQLVDQLPAAIYRQDASGDQGSTYVSPSFSSLLGLDPDDFPIGFAAFFDRMHQDDREVARRAAERAERTGEPMDIEYRLRRRDGEWTWIHDRSVLERDDEGRTRVWTGVLLDIGERKRLEASLRESEARLRTIVEQLPAAVYRLDRGGSGRFSYTSPRFAALTGLPADRPDETLDTLLARVHPDDVAALRQAGDEADRTGRPFEAEYRLRGRDGAWTWVHDSSMLSDGGQGEPDAWHGVLLDISEQKRLQELLEESEERFRSTFEGAGIGMSLTDPDGRIFDANPAFCQLLGYSRDELLEKTFVELSHPDDHDVSRASLSGHLRGETLDYVFDKRYIRKDGQVVWARLTTTALRHADGQLRYIITQVEDITARREAEAALNASEARFRSTFEGAGIGMTMASPERTILLANPAVGRLLGYAPDELVGASIDSLSSAVDAKAEKDLRRRLRAGEIDAFQIERRYWRKDGEEVSALVDVAAIRDHQGGLEATIGQIQDVTARKEAEAALRDSEARFRTLVQNDPDVISVIDTAGDVVYMSPSARTAFGLTPEEMLGPWRSRAQFIHPDDREQALGLFDRVDGEPGATASIEARLWHETLGWRWFQVTVANLLEDPGIAGYVFNVRDITERKEAEAALGDSEALFRSIFEGAGIGMALSGPDGQIRVVNPAFEQMLDYGPGELTGLHVNTITHPDDLTLQIDNVRRALAGEIDTYQMEKRYLRKDGGVMWGQLHASVVRDERGAMRAIIGQVQDVTARREAEAALRESETRFRALVQYDPDIIAVVDEAMRLTYISPSAEMALGIPVADLLGPAKPRLHFFHPEDQHLVLAKFGELQDTTGGVVTTEAKVRHADRGWRWYHITISDQRADPRIAGYLINLRDISELKEAELAIKSSLAVQEQANAELERLNQTKSRFLSTISHEFRTPLTAIIGYSELLASDGVDAAAIAEDAAVIHREASRLNRMVDEVLFVDRVDSGRLTLKLEFLDPNILAQEAVATFRRLTERHQFRLELDPDVHRVKGDHDRLAQALTNLVSNAVKYSPSGGTVTVSTRNLDDEVILAVRDEGIGLLPQDKERIFDRFERVETGIAGRIGGTGLGLAIVREIAQIHDGRVWVESTPRKGSTFSLALPARRKSRSRRQDG